MSNLSAMALCAVLIVATCLSGSPALVFFAIALLGLILTAWAEESNT